ncbi:uncharacterized protein PV06_09208 [Exophiala oligosperma]|uniref:HPP transmembrane region domain-containing protein n=2 Tax=Chaetothyriales TaxID=34395 RepID=A0A0D2DR31_9EURO|nr:uncharacterized protein PV06_09208 [Exophiala oligosperma]KAJ9643333.1 hypothetical protein H2204_002229 [Knufia peltigerae]KIW38224.1 hypothetical protein PV06_09208 [Exophiala oligosperma]
MPLINPARLFRVHRDPPKPRRPFDIDNYLNPFIPQNPLRFFPSWFSHWFGYRAPRASSAGQKPPQPHSPFHTLSLYLSVMLGAFCGVAIIENVFLALPTLSGHAAPIIIASFGAAAILEYNTIESPLAQPRNLVVGHFLSAVVAVGITKLFEHLPPDRFEELRWLAGALAVGAASAVMSLTKTVHPPAGATALLAATNVEIQELGWWLLPLVLLAAMLMLASALLLNNVFDRRFPVYWWTPVDLSALREERRQEKIKTASDDVERGSARGGPVTNGSEGISDADTEAESNEAAVAAPEILDKVTTRMSRSVSISRASRVPHLVVRGKPSHATRKDTEGEDEDEDDRIIITPRNIIVPDWFEVNDWEDEVLRILMDRLRTRASES